MELFLFPDDPVTGLDEEPFSDPVERQKVMEAAKQQNIKPDKNWC